MEEVDGMLEGFMRDAEGFGGGICEGRALRISRSSKSEATSLISPSEGSLSLTSSIRAWDMMVVGDVNFGGGKRLLWRGLVGLKRTKPQMSHAT